MRMYQPLTLGLSLLGLWLGSALPSSAMSVVAPSFSEMVAKAETVARVEVTTQKSQWDISASGQKVIHTYVQLRVIKQLKGEPQTTLSLRFLGGQVGTSVMSIPDMPTFVTGERYIVFVADNGRAFCPLVGIMHGTYRLATDASGTDHVLRSNGRGLPSVEAVKASDEGAASPDETAMKRDDFEQAIAEEVRRASAH